MSKSVWLDVYGKTIDSINFRIEEIKLKGTFQDSLLNLNEISYIINGLKNECMVLSEKVESLENQLAEKSKQN